MSTNAIPKILIFIFLLISFVYSAVPVALIAAAASQAGSAQQQQQVEEALAAVGQAVVAIESAYAQVRLMQLAYFLQEVLQHTSTQSTIHGVADTIQGLTATEIGTTISVLRSTAAQQMAQ